jgi:hypothetical protein
MEVDHLRKIMQSFKGATFASLDAETKPRPGIIRRTFGERVILFRMDKGSGYENIVNRRLEELGMEPKFRVGPLPWGGRVDDNLPLIQYKGFYYLQTIQLKEGDEKYFIFDREIPKDELPAFGIQPKGGSNTGLPRGEKVIIQTYSLDNIRAIRLLGWEVFGKEARPKKPMLKLKG